MRDVSDGMASVNTWIGYASQLKERANRKPKKSDIGNKSELGIKTCSVNETCHNYKSNTFECALKGFLFQMEPLYVNEEQQIK